MRNIITALNPFFEDYHHLNIEELEKIIKKHWGISNIKKKDRNNREALLKFMDDYFERVNKKGSAFRKD